MILDANTHTETNCNIKGNSFSIKASPVAFDILSSKLYSNPVLAVVRELLTNAYDSQVAAGNPDKEIQVVFPTPLDTEFSIRDFGTGLSKEDVMTLYTTFFDSTKADTNDFTGGFGLGSKTPFSYTSSFSVTSFYNGKKYIFLATKKDGYPSIIPLTEEPTDEPNGLYIRIPVNKDNGTQSGVQFFEEAKRYLAFIPEIKISCNKELPKLKPFIEWENIKFYKLTRKNPVYHWQYLRGIFIKQGQNIYDIEKYLRDSPSYNKLSSGIFSSIDVVYEVPIGTLGITPSREQLSNDESNKPKIEAIVEDLLSKASNMVKYFIDNIESFKDRDIPYELIDQYSKTLYKKYFSFSESLRQYSFTWNTDYSSIRLDALRCKIIRASGTEQNEYIDSIHKQIFLYVSDISDQRIIRKLRNIINNYEELQDEKIIIRLVDIKHTWTYKELDGVLSRLRFLKGITWTLNNAEELKYDIEVLPVTAFLRKYPNQKNPKKTVSKPRGPKCTNIHYINLTSYSDAGLMRISSADDLKCFTKENTLVIPVDIKEHNIAAQFKLLYDFFTTVPLNLKDIEGNTFIANFIMDKLHLTLENLRFPKMYIILTAKGNMSKFKDYTTIGVDDIFNLVKETKFICYKQYSGSWGLHIKRFQDFVDKLKEPYKAFVESTYLYKRHTLVLPYAYGSKPIIKDNYNYLDNAAINYLLYVVGIDRSTMYPDREKFINRVINSDLACLYRELSHRIRYYHGTAHVPNFWKLQIIRYLRGEKYVLF